MPRSGRSLSTFHAHQTQIHFIGYQQLQSLPWHRPLLWSSRSQYPVQQYSWIWPWYLCHCPPHRGLQWPTGRHQRKQSVHWDPPVTSDSSRTEHLEQQQQHTWQMGASHHKDRHQTILESKKLEHCVKKRHHNCHSQEIWVRFNQSLLSMHQNIHITNQQILSATPKFSALPWGCLHLHLQILFLLSSSSTGSVASGTDTFATETMTKAHMSGQASVGCKGHMITRYWSCTGAGDSESQCSRCCFIDRIIFTGKIPEIIQIDNRKVVACFIVELDVYRIGLRGSMRLLSNLLLHLHSFIGGGTLPGTHAVWSSIMLIVRLGCQ